MRKLAIAMTLVLAPAVSHAQPSSPATSGTSGSAAASGPSTKPSGADTYGPPAPTVTADTAVGAVTPTPATPDGEQPAARHRGHRRNGYAGLDTGIGR